MRLVVGSGGGVVVRIVGRCRTLGSVAFWCAASVVLGARWWFSVVVRPGPVVVAFRLIRCVGRASGTRVGMCGVMLARSFGSRVSGLVQGAGPGGVSVVGGLAGVVVGR